MLLVRIFVNCHFRPGRLDLLLDLWAIDGVTGPW